MDAIYWHGDKIWCVTLDGVLFQAEHKGPGEDDYGPWEEIDVQETKLTDRK